QYNRIRRFLSKSLHPAYVTPYSQKVTFSDNVVCPSTVPVTVPLPVPVTAILKGKSDRFLVSSITVVVPSASVFTTLTWTVSPAPSGAVMVKYWVLVLFESAG